MKILYAIQGTGNGHLSRARDIIPRLQKKGEVDLVISGCQSDMPLPYAVKYKLKGLSFVFGRKGGIDYIETFKKSNLKNLFYEIMDLPINQYDLIINDFEPVSAWACYIKNKQCIGLSHQLGVLNKNAPRPSKKDFIGDAFLRYYAPCTKKFGFHFLSYDKNIFTPVIREEVRSLPVSNSGHYTVYLPAYSDKAMIKVLSCFPEVEWQIFSKHAKAAYTLDHIHVKPIQNEGFLNSMASSEGVLCGAGFETPAEVLFLKKKLLVIPMKGQYEQQCNAAALEALGVPVLNKLKTKHISKIRTWLDNHEQVHLPLPDETNAVIDIVLRSTDNQKQPKESKQTIVDRPSELRALIVKKIFS
jgi:uncharacterized protein (TIGR00661 family)